MIMINLRSFLLLLQKRILLFTFRISIRTIADINANDMIISIPAAAHGETEGSVEPRVGFLGKIRYKITLASIAPAICAEMCSIDLARENFPAKTNARVTAGL